MVPHSGSAEQRLTGDIFSGFGAARTEPHDAGPAADVNAQAHTVDETSARNGPPPRSRRSFSSLFGYPMPECRSWAACRESVRTKRFTVVLAVMSPRQRVYEHCFEDIARSSSEKLVRGVIPLLTTPSSACCPSAAAEHTPSRTPHCGVHRRCRRQRLKGWRHDRGRVPPCRVADGGRLPAWHTQRPLRAHVCLRLTARVLLMSARPYLRVLLGHGAPVAHVAPSERAVQWGCGGFCFTEGHAESPPLLTWKSA